MIKNVKSNNRLKRISGCRYTPRQRHEFARKLTQGREYAQSNAWSKEWTEYAEQLTQAM